MSPTKETFSTSSHLLWQSNAFSENHLFWTWQSHIKNKAELDGDIIKTNTICINGLPTSKLLHLLSRSNKRWSNCWKEL